MPRSAGQPTKYKPEYCEQVIELGKQGKSPAQMCAHFGIARGTIDWWVDNNPEFAEAFKVARVHCQNWWENAGQEGLRAEKFNATVWRTSMQARFREDYTEKRTHEITGKDGEPIQTEVNLSHVTDEQLGVLKEIFGPLAAASGDDEGDTGGGS